ncbi:hypothetical protein ACIOWG_19980 [Streptomyces sp. NPDC087658]|uniref:hypothetical protein n=1 Tax=Streptomyces sp. NPDC087658 TaxID=3365800 RepID=UPI0038143913
MSAADFATAFRMLVHEAMLRNLDDRVLGQVVAPLVYLTAGPVAEVGQTFEELVVRGRAEGVIATHITAFDLRILASGLILALVRRQNTDKEHWHRAADLIIAACRSEPAAPMG